MKTIDEYLDEQINEQLCQAVLSGSKGEGPSKAKIRPVEIKGQVIYQVSETVGTKVLHRNYHREELIQYLKEGLQHHFSQLQSSGMTLDGTVLVRNIGYDFLQASGSSFYRDAVYRYLALIELQNADNGF